MEAPTPLAVKTVEKIIDSKESQEITECLKSLEVQASQIGQGRNAVVYAAEGTVYEKVCLKKLRPKPELLCNTIDEEHEFQRQAKKIGIRTPLALISMETDQGTYLVMERVFGPTVAEAAADPRLLPESYDYARFCASLEEQMAALHRADMYHRDLHGGNVMIDQNDGLPIIIDFGTAIKAYGGEMTYDDLASVYNSQTGRYEQRSRQYRNDDEAVRAIRISLKGAKRPDIDSK